MPLLEALLDASSSVLLAIAFRLLPFVCFAVCARRIELTDKLVALLVYVGGASFILRDAPDARDVLRDLLAIHAAWVLLLFALVRAWPRIGAHGVTRPVLLLVGCVAWALVPLGLGRSGIRTGMVVVGIDGAMSVASYLLGATTHAFRPAAFFVLVDPNLSFRQAARPDGTPHLSLGVVLRALRGFVTLLVGIVLLERSAPLAFALSTAWGGAGTRFVASAIGLCAGFYATHAGLADVQISAMRALGYAVGERYVGPLRALSPGDFWARWNTYMAGWLRDHVYLPTARVLQGRVSRAVASDLAVITTFLVSGAIHIGAQKAMHGVAPIRFFLFFLVNGVAVVVWSRVQRRLAAHRDGVGARSYVALSRVAFLVFLVVVVGAGLA